MLITGILNMLPVKESEILKTNIGAKLEKPDYKKSIDSELLILLKLDMEKRKSEKLPMIFLPSWLTSSKDPIKDKLPQEPSDIIFLSMKPPVLPTLKKPELIPMFTTLVLEKPTKIVVMMVMFPNVPSKST